MPIVPILVSVVLSLATVFGVYNYVPADLLQLPQFSQPKLGSTITTILGTDTLSASRATINTNFSNLNTDKLQSGDTASTLTITTLTNTTANVGTLNLTNKLTVPNGGTASTTLSSNQVLIGNGTSEIGVVSGWGNSGQFLTSNGGVLAPTWQSASVDGSANYAWTGVHNFVGTATYIKALTASSTLVVSDGGAGLTLTLPTIGGSSGQVLVTNGGSPQVISFATTTPVRFALIDNTDLSASSGNYATSTSSLFIPANTLTASSTIAFKAASSACISTSSGGGTVYLRTSTGAELASVGIVSDNSSGTGTDGSVSIVIGSNNSATFSSQIWNGSQTNGYIAGATTMSFGGIEGTASIDFTSGVTLKVVVLNTGCNTSAPTLSGFSIVAER